MEANRSRSFLRTYEKSQLIAFMIDFSLDTFWLRFGMGGGAGWGQGVYVLSLTREPGFLSKILLEPPKPKTSNYYPPARKSSETPKPHFKPARSLGLSRKPNSTTGFLTFPCRFILMRLNIDENRKKN